MRAAVALLLCGAFLAAESSALRSGLDLSTLDPSVRPQDNLYRFANGGWLDRTVIPPDRVVHSTFSELTDRAELAVRRIVEGLTANSGVERQLRDLYYSILDESAIEERGAEPLRGELNRIDAITSVSELAAQMGRMSAIGAGGLFEASAGIDAENPYALVAAVTQGGTLLADRRFYFDPAPSAAEHRDKYVSYLTTIFRLAGRRDPARAAQDVLALETDLARYQVPSEMARTSNMGVRFKLQKLNTELPGFDWDAWARPQGFDRATFIVLNQPSFFRAFARQASAAPLDSWKALLAARYITAASIYVASPFADARFEFFGRTLTGQEEPRERWKRAVSLVNGFMGDAVGQLYVREHFPERSWHRVKGLVGHVRGAFAEAVAEAEWMTPSTRRQARAKLEHLRVEIGYPTRVRDYSGLVIHRDDLLGNTQRAQSFENDFRMQRLRRRATGRYWMTPPQTVNAYYSASRNEIVLPAAVLQAPLFDADADDAVNYGGIGAIIGHEMGHAFDRRGRNFNAWGGVDTWWTEEDDAGFRERALPLIAQFNAYSPLPGHFVNGALTFGENVGDVGGLAIAVRAYRRSLNGRPAPVIDGFTGEQRLFIRWAQVWRTLMREDFLRQTLTLSRHAPPEYRAHGALVNLDAFHEAFDVRPGDGLYRAPEKRVRIW